MVTELLGCDVWVFFTGMVIIEDIQIKEINLVNLILMLTQITKLFSTIAHPNLAAMRDNLNLQHD